jgi:phosphotransferase system HPr-like phosphotransfer protein
MDIKLQASKLRLIITTDIGGGDPDDQQSMVHALTCTNEFELEGIIYGNSWTGANFTAAKTRIEAMIKAYEEVYPNLKVHAEGYPTAEYLRSIYKQGQAQPSMNSTGEGKDSEGSNLILAAADDPDDPRPIWLNAWGGANTIGQAFWKVKNTRTPEEVTKFLNKVRIYDILGQDDAGSWVSKNFPEVVWIRNSTGVYGWAPDRSWTSSNVQSKGVLGKIYPNTMYATEGDSPAFFHILSRGLNDPDQLTQGGWGGRHGPDKKADVPLFEWAAKDAVCNANDKKLRPYYIYTNTSEGTAAINKWKSEILNDQAVRMDWSIKAKYSDANHFPIAVVNGDSTMQILDMDVKAGDQVTLNTEGSSDPDGNTLTYAWQFYKEASSYTESVTIEGSTSATAKITVPAASGKNIHIILVVKDNGTPSLHAYRRVILNVK